MQEYGLDIAQNHRTQLTPEMLRHFDQVIIMAEPDTIPEYLSGSRKMAYWDISDPAHMDLTGTKQICEQIRGKVLELAEK